MAGLIEPDENGRDQSYVFERKELRSRSKPFKLSVVGECGKLYGYVRDISASGLQVRTFKSCDGLPKRAGKTVILLLSAPGEPPVECKAQIRWSRTTSDLAEGVELQGMEFIDPSNEAKVAISRLIKAYRNGGA
jgi:hypothetical protein